MSPEQELTQALQELTREVRQLREAVASATELVVPGEDFGSALVGSDIAEAFAVHRSAARERGGA